MIGLIAVTASGRAAADRLAQAWPGRTRLYRGPARQAVPRAWTQCDGLVCFLAVGATVRLIAPLLNSKWTDPAVVCVDESAKHAVAVLGGHAAGANALAVRVAGVFGADAVITTATDAMSLPGLEDLGWPTEGAIGAVGRALLDGEPVRLESADRWPLPPLPANVGDTGADRILITDRLIRPDARTAVLRPPALIVGVQADGNAGPVATDAGSASTGSASTGSASTGSASTGSARTVQRLVDEALVEAGLSAACVSGMAVVHPAPPAIVSAAREAGWPVRLYPPSALTAARAPGTPWRPGRLAPGNLTPGSLAEAAALAGAAAADLVVPERAADNVRVAIARVRPRGRLALIGIGPGQRDLLTQRAVSELRRASVLAGPGPVLEQVTGLARPGARVLASKPGDVDAGTRRAVAEARTGHAVGIVVSGDDAGAATAALVLSLAGDDIEVVDVPGITAGVAAAVAAGAPLGSPHAEISLSGSDLPGELERQVAAAAGAGFVISIPVSPGQVHGERLKTALATLRQSRPECTPVAVVWQPGHSRQQVRLATLGGLDEALQGALDGDVPGMLIIGAPRTRVIAGRMITTDLTTTGPGDG